MNHSFRKRRALKALIGCLALPLMSAGCQHSNVATTQVVLSQDATTQEAATQESSTQVAPVATTASETPAPVVMTQEPATAEASTQAMAVTEPTTQQSTEESAGESSSSGISAYSAKAGHGIAEASRTAGHAIAQTSRNAYYSTAAAVGEVPSSVVDITTNSAVRIRNTPPESLTAPIIDVDEAMQVRDWDQVTANYSSGAFVAGNIGFLYAPRPGQNAWRYQIIDLPLFLGNTALLPFAFAQTPPWKPVEWKAATVAPTYTGVPPLPAE